MRFYDDLPERLYPSDFVFAEALDRAGPAAQALIREDGEDPERLLAAASIVLSEVEAAGIVFAVEHPPDRERLRRALKRHVR